MNLPDKVNILGVEYAITYFDSPSDVDIYKRKSLCSQIDFWTRTIRIYNDGKRPDEDIWQTIFHEVMHGIAKALCLKSMKRDENHDELDILALAITDVIFRNGWMS